MKFVAVAAAVAAALCASASGWAADGDIGRIKTVTGTVHVLRAAQQLKAEVGLGLRTADVVVTEADSSVGMTFTDTSLLSLGPYSTLALDSYRFDATTHEGGFDTSLSQGTLSVKSGKLVQQAPEAMKIQTPTAILGVRGTEFVVRAAAE